MEQILHLRKKAHLLFQRVAALEEAIEDEDESEDVRLYAEMHLPDARAAWKREKVKATRLEQQLGVDDTTVLRKLKHSEYYSAQMNAKALKERLRAKLRDRKFEFDPIERSVGRARSGK